MKYKSNFIMQNIGGEKLLVPIGSQVMDMNGLITLNETAACVWELLAEDRTINDLIDTIVDQFDVARERAQADVQSFIDEMTRMGLIEQ